MRRNRTKRDRSDEHTARNEFGVIVTLRDQLTGELRSVHAPGLRREALRWICERIDRDELHEWRVLSYSTPETILGDIHNGGREVHDGVGKHVTHLQLVEAQALGAIKRRDLLDPSLERWNKNGRKWSHGV